MNKFFVLFCLLIFGLASESFGQLTDPGRGMYVNRFFRTSANQSGVVIVDPNYSILSIQAKEDSLLAYARDNHITYLILYDLHRVFGSALYESYLCSFIQKAKSNYCINRIGVASSCAAMFDNVANISATDPYTFSNTSYPAALGFVQNYYPPGDPMFYLAEATKLGIRATTFNDDCANKIDIIVTEFEFWNSGADNCTGQSLTKDQKYQNYQSMINYMDEIRDNYNANHTHKIYVETYLGYLNQNTAYAHQNIANWIDGSYNGKRRVDRLLLHYYSADPSNLYSRTTSGANYSGYYQTRFVDFSQNTTNENSNVLPIFSSENTAWGAGSNFLGAWFNLNRSNNIFTAEKIWYNDWYGDANIYSPSLIGNPSYGNTILPGGAIWFTSNYMINHLERPLLFTSNSPVCVSAGQNGTFQFQYQGPIEQGVNFRFYITNANDTTLLCGTRSLQSWPAYNGSTQTSIDLNAALNGCSLPVGDYDAHLELNYAASCSTYVSPVRRISVVTSGRIVALTPTTVCQGNPVYLQASSTGNGTSTFQWYKGTTLISGATSSSYAPTSAGTSDYSCKITSSNGSCSANLTPPLSVTINTYPSASITVQSSTSCAKVIKANPAGASYLWPDGSTASTYPAMRSGNYSVAVSTNGCKSIATYTLSNVSASLEEFHAECPGLQNGYIKVKLSSGTAPYKLTWSGPVNGADSGLASGNYLIDQLAAGNYSIVVTDANGCTATLQPLVPVASLPAITISGNSPVCNGQTLSLSATGGTIYNWSGPNNFSSNIRNPILPSASILNSGVYTVIVTNQNGCTGSMSMNVVVATTFNAMAFADSVCSGSDLNLGASAGTSYLWTGPAGFTSNLQYPVINNVSTINSGIYVVTVTNASGCTFSASASALVYSMPSINISHNGPVCIGGELNLSSTGGIQYDWEGPNGFMSSMQNPVKLNMTFADTGFYTVNVTDSNLCVTSDSAYVSLMLLSSFYYDEDNDGYGTDSLRQFCLPTGFFSAVNNGDCNDTNPAMHPFASEICYNGIDENCNGLWDDSCSDVLHIKLFVEGYYLGNNVMRAVLNPQGYPTICDSFIVRLHSVNFPYQVIYICKDTVDVYGNGFFHFPGAVIGNEFYVSIVGRNTLETWSKNPVLFAGNHVNYNFTLNANKAFGSNMKDLGDGNYALISGDLNQDGNINLSDILLLNASASDFSFGYSINDLTGDHFVESIDFSLLENNLSRFLMKP